MSLALEFLKKQMEALRAANPSLSNRSFAKQCGLTAGEFSGLFAGKRNLTKRNALKIADGINLPLKSREKLLRYFGELIDEKNPDDAVDDLKEETYDVLEEEKFQYIYNWHGYAVLSLMENHNFVSDPHWIAERLGITVNEAKDCLESLCNAQLIEKKKGGFKKIRDRLTTRPETPSEVLRKVHRSCLMKSIEALDQVPVDLRDITAVTVAIDPKNIKRAKQLIKNFRRSFAPMVEQGKKTEVYHLHIAFIPFTKV